VSEFSGKADPARILPLLWRKTATSGTGASGTPANETGANQTDASGTGASGTGGSRTGASRTATGRPPRLSVDAVVAAAIALAGAEGLAATSMGRLATQLGVGTMTLYTYVPSRAELVDLMVDEVLASRDLPGPGAPRPADWRAQVELYADRTRAMYANHPWLAQVSTVRPPIGPGMLAEREYVLSTVRGLGLPAGRVNTAAVTIAAFVTSAARLDAEDALLRRTTGESTDAWWLRRGELWEKWFDVERYPVMTELWNNGGFDRGADEQFADAYGYGLRLLLDGIEADARH
jgi:AcrR family transcriptional regulator